MRYMTLGGEHCVVDPIGEHGLYPIWLSVKRVVTLLAALLFAMPAHAMLAGVGAADVGMPVGVPLAGYGAMERRMPAFLDWGNRHVHASLFRPSTGRFSPIRSKAMVVRSGDGQVVFVSLDLIGVEKKFISDLAERLVPLGVREEQLIVGATHTHSGPGTISRRASMALVAVDRFRRENYELLLDRIVASVEQAFATLQPVDLLVTDFRTDGLQRNKWRNKGERHYDDRARFLLARSRVDGRLLGGFVNYAIHGNGMPISDLRFSWDVPGSIAYHIERLVAAQNPAGGQEPVVLFLNGAEGDVGNVERSIEAVTRHGEWFAEQADAAGVFEDMRSIDGEVSVMRRKVWLGLPGYPFGICNRDHTPRDRPGLDIRLPLWFMQQRTWVSVAHIGELTLLTWPGEASTQVGYDTQAMVEQLGFPDPWILGLANDYQSYFTTRAEYNEGNYDACSSLFRWKGTERIQRAFKSLLNGNSS